MTTDGYYEAKDSILDLTEVKVEVEKALAVAGTPNENIESATIDILGAVSYHIKVEIPTEEQAAINKIEMDRLYVETWNKNHPDNPITEASENDKD